LDTVQDSICGAGEQTETGTPIRSGIHPDHESGCALLHRPISNEVCCVLWNLAVWALRMSYAARMYLEFRAFAS